MGGASKALCESRGKTVRHTMPAHFYPLSVFHMFFVTLVLACVIEAAQAKEFLANRNVRTCVCDGEYDASVDYFKNKAKAQFSTGWNVTYHNSYKVIQDPVTGLKSYLVLCGTPVPPQVQEGDQVVSIPVNRASVDSSTMFHFFEYIGQRTSLTYYDSSLSYVSNECVTKMGDENLIADRADYAIKDSNVAVRFISQYAFNKEKLDAVPIPYFVLDEANEATVLGRSEWVEFVSLFFNREEAANSVAGLIDDRYDCHAAEVTAELAKAGVERKKVVEFYLDFYSAKINQNCSNFADAKAIVRACPAAECELWDAAGADLITFPAGAGKKSVAVNQTEFLAGASSAEVIFYTNDLAYMPPQCTDRFNDFLTGMDAAVNGEFYDLTRTVSAGGGTAYFEAAKAEPDVLLLDMISTTFPALVPTHSRYFLRKHLAPNAEQQIVLTAADCTDVEAPLFNDWRSVACNESSGDAVVVGVNPVKTSDVCLADGTDDNSASLGRPSFALVGCAALFALLAVVA